MTPLTRYIRDQARALERDLGPRYQPRGEPVAELDGAKVYRREPFLSRCGGSPQGAGKAYAQEMGDE